LTDPIWDAYLSQSPACHWVVGPDGRIAFIRGSTEGIFRMACEAILGRTLAEILPAVDAELWQQRLAEAWQGQPAKLTLNRRTGDWRVALFPLRHRDQVTHIAGLAYSDAPDFRSAVFAAIDHLEHERERMARFLHDSMGQDLSAAGLHLDLIRLDLERTDAPAAGRVAEVQRMLDSSMDQVRRLSGELYPVSIERAGLRACLTHLTGRVRPAFTGTIELTFDQDVTLSPLQAKAIYHIAAEAVSNSLQHAACSVVEIAVQSDSEGPYLRVRDNGQGFDPGRVREGRAGLGLLTMEHYAEVAGLRVGIQSVPGQGTAISVHVRGGKQ
jgi:signal transduction histidine kinase